MTRWPQPTAPSTAAPTDEEQRVLDLGAGTDPDPRATATVDRSAPADHDFDLREEWPLADASVDGLTAHHVVEHLPDTAHVFREAARVLRDGGWLAVTVPLGDDAETDLDHCHEWKWATPGQFCQQRRRHWDPAVPFELVRKDLDVWLGGPLAPLSPAFQRVADRWPGWGADRCFAGELRARYRRRDR